MIKESPVLVSVTRAMSSPNMMSEEWMNDEFLFFWRLMGELRSLEGGSLPITVSLMPLLLTGEWIRSRSLQFLCVWWLWAKMVIYLNYICAVRQPEHSWGWFWQSCTHIWKHNGHQPLLLLRSALQLIEQKFPLGHLCVLPLCRQQCGNVSGCWSLTFCQCVPEGGSCVTEGAEKSELVCWSLERGGGAQLGKVHPTREAGMLCRGRVGRQHFSNLLHALARRWPLLS